MNIGRVLDRVNGAMSKLSRAQIFGVALLTIALVGIPDYLTGVEISLSLFYLGPVGIATWYAGRGTGMLIAFISALSALVGDASAEHIFMRPGIMAWDGFLHLGFMLVVAYLLDRLRVHIKIEQELARTDPLTGILNRRAFLEHLEYRLGLAVRDAKPIVLAYIDLDDFKQINDRGGHHEGDRVLRLVAGTLAASIRRTDVIARLGGDEFGLLIVGADQTAAESVVAKLKQSLLEALASEESVVTCSIGCVAFQISPATSDVALRAADALMYKVKGLGKNAVAFEIFDDQPSHSNHPESPMNHPG